MNIKSSIDKLPPTALTVDADIADPHLANARRESELPKQICGRTDNGPPKAFFENTDTIEPSLTQLRIDKEEPKLMASCVDKLLPSLATP
jgi:hypothetical protein